MEGAVLSTTGNNSFRAHLKNAASALWTRTLPKQRRSETVSSSTRHHTYPRATPPKRSPISCGLEPFSHEQQPTPCGTPTDQQTAQNAVEDVDMVLKPDTTVKLTGALAREVANAWGSRIGPPEQPAPADRIQSLFNDIELYPTKTQVFEMLVCASKCARRKSLTLTFGEFCVFAAELRRYSRQARQTPTKPESPQWSTDKEACKHLNGSEASPPPCEVFLGGSCNPTTWRSDIAIPMLKKMGITYFNPQVEDWSTELMEVEHRAKAAARALLFVLDSETRAVAASVEAAHLAAAPRDLLLVLRPYSRHQRIGNETISDQEYVELSRARATLQEAVERRGLPAFADIPAALRCARAVLRGARTQPRHSLGHTILRLKRAFDGAGGRAAKVPRARAVHALRELARTNATRAERVLPSESDSVDFETFCAAVAELAADTENQPRNGTDADTEAVEGATGERVSEQTNATEPNGLNTYNARLRACGRKLGLLIPKNGGYRGEAEGGGTATGDSSGDSVFTPGTERRLERLPAMLGAPVHDVYLAGTFPASRHRPEETLRREGLSCVSARANDYTRMFSTGAPPDKRPRPEPAEPGVTLRDQERHEPTDRLSASEFYAVTEDRTPQPFKGTYDEDLLLGSRTLVFSLSADSPNFAVMVLAAHYMGLRPHATVLLVQTMDPRLASPYSEVAVKDYNRGRHYLMDLARRSNVPVFDNTADTVACVVARLREASLGQAPTET